MLSIIINRNFKIQFSDIIHLFSFILFISIGFNLVNVVLSSILSVCTIWSTMLMNITDYEAILNRVPNKVPNSIAGSSDGDVIVT